MGSYWMSMLVSIAPFAFLLVLWFLMLRSLQAEKRRATKNPFGTTQEMSTADVAAELRSLRESVEALRKEIADRR